jgi:Protein of unknown function (DUF3995)
MATSMTVAGLLTLLVASIHGWLGGRVVLRPTLAAPLHPVVRATQEVAWHVITWHFVVLGLALLASAWLVPDAAPATAAITGVSALGYALTFLVLGLRRFGDPWHLPQWVLFGPLAAITLVAPHFDAHALLGLRPFAAGLGALLFVAISALHFAWAGGASFPARDRDALVAAAVGSTIGSKMPDGVATVVVAIGLLMFALCTAALGGLVRPFMPEPWLRVAGYAMIVIFALRCIAGFFEVVLRPSIRGTPYMRLSRLVYSPLAGLLALLVACAMLR